MIARSVFLYVAFLLAALLSASLRSAAQLCSGSLGDPVVSINFGAGTSTHAGALASGITSYTYTPADFPNDGSYTISNSTAGSGSVWWSTTDHTGDSGGYMMVVNASISTTDYFYKNTVSGLCPGTTYKFAAWVVNLLRSSDTSPPNITFSIETTGGTILNSYTTGSIPRTGSGPAWKQYGFYFTTPQNVTDVVIRMRNNSAGGAPANDLALDDITFRPCGPVVAAGFSSGEAAESLCEGGSVTLQLKASVSDGYTDARQQWQVNENGRGWTDIAGAVSTSATVTLNNAAAGTYQYRLAVGESANFSSAQCRIASNTLTLTVYPSVQAAASSGSPVCAGERLQLRASGGSTYQWTGPANFSSTEQNPVITAVSDGNAGTYTVVVTSAEGCTATAQTTVVVGSRPVLTVSPSVTICEGESTELQASGGSTYNWSPLAGLSDASTAAPLASPAVTTTYTVSAYDSGHTCPATATVTVTVLNKPVADAGPDKSLVAGNSVQLEGSVSGAEYTYLWSPAVYLDDPAKLNPVASPGQTTTYTLTAVSENGCGYTTDEVTVKVFDRLVIPNTFSPNGDGVNDVWNIAGLDSYTGAELSVYNRYGTKLYHSSGYASPWDGTCNGRQLPVGAYYYRIDLKNDFKSLSGWIAIVR